MPRLKGEAKNQDVEEIEEGIVKSSCFHCHGKQQRYVKTVTLLDSLGNVSVTRTKNEIGCCINPHCFRYGNPLLSPSWTRI